jgi:hypothetical protein
MFNLVMNCGVAAANFILLASIITVVGIVGTYFSKFSAKTFILISIPLMLLPLATSFIFQEIGIRQAKKAVALADPVIQKELMERGIEHAGYCVSIGVKLFYVPLVIFFVLLYLRNKKPASN